MLRDIFHGNMAKSQHHIMLSGMAHYCRDVQDHTYLVLLESTDRFVTSWSMEQNRASQEANNAKRYHAFNP